MDSVPHIAAILPHQATIDAALQQHATLDASLQHQDTLDASLQQQATVDAALQQHATIDASQAHSFRFYAPPFLSAWQPRSYWPLYCDSYLGIMSPPLDMIASFLEQNVPQELVNYRIKDRGYRHHITIVTPPEMDYLPAIFKKNYNALQEYALSILKGSYVRVLGIGRRFEKVQSPQGHSVKDKWDVVYFAIVEWKAGQHFRASIGLPKADFHITLGYNHFDLFDVKKDRSTMIYHLNTPYQFVCPFFKCHHKKPGFIPFYKH